MIYCGYTELGAYRNIGNLSQASLNKILMFFTNSGFSAKPKVTLTKPKLTSTNRKLTRNANPTLLKTPRYNTAITVIYA